ncbi:MAG: hypothetical protein IT379_10465 [Deltaproteobacteria bacterium]|nr:hypothetical protein [Deltaproteobacteria bacterium]
MGRTNVAWVWVVCLAASCGNVGGATSGRETFDAATPPPPLPPPAPPEDPDGGVRGSDASPSGDAGAVLDPAPTDGLDGAWAACGDRLPELDALVDCASPSCAAAPICCADSEACCVPGGTSIAVGFAGCTGTPDAACLGDLELLGDARPALVPEGGGAALWLAAAGPRYVTAASRTRFDPTNAIEITASIASLRTCSVGACQEMIGIGLAPEHATTPDEAPVAAVLSAATSQLLLLSNGEVIRRSVVDLSRPVAGTLRLALDAAGDARATFAPIGAAETSATMHAGATAATPLRVMAFGRGENTSSATLVVRDVTATSRVCDRPSTWSIATVAVQNGRTLPRPWTHLAVADGPGAEGPSRRFVLTAGGVTYAGALSADGTLALETGSEGAIVGSYSDGTAPTEEAGALVYSTARARWELYVSRAGRDIVRLPSSAGDRFDRSSAEPVLSASSIPASAIDQPAVTIDFRGYTTLAFRARLADGSSWIGSARDHGDGELRPDADSVVPSESASAFDRDGVESPALVSYGELTHLHYVGRRGVSRAIGLARRTGAGGWERYGGDSPVLAASDEPWRNFGVAAPAVAVAPGAAGGLLDVYFVATGTDGESLGRARREIPWSVP